MPAIAFGPKDVELIDLPATLLRLAPEHRGALAVPGGQDRPEAFVPLSGPGTHENASATVPCRVDEDPTEVVAFEDRDPTGKSARLLARLQQLNRVDGLHRRR